MMNFSGENRGYFFVCYTCPEDAKQAIKELNNYEIRPGKPLGVIHSVDNRKLWISGIPKNRSPEEIKTDMEKLTDGVKNIILYPSLIDKSKTRGYAFVEYESHRAAALARRKLVPGRIFVCGQEVEKIDWAEPENEVDEETMAKVKILFIRNLMASTSEDSIIRVFNKFSNGQVERVKKSRDYAFVHFTSRESAEKALLGVHSVSVNPFKIDGAEVEVTWSKPVDKYAYNTRKLLTKALTTGFNPINGNSCSTTGINPQFPLELIQDGMMNPMLNNFNDNGKWNGSITPRGRGAAGVKGIGGPGTMPPSRLLLSTFGTTRPVINNGKTSNRAPSDITKSSLVPIGYDSQNSAESLANAAYYQQHIQNLLACPAYAEQYAKGINDMKLMGGASYYPYSCLYNNESPLTGNFNCQESSNAQTDVPPNTPTENTSVGRSTNVVNAIYAPLTLPIPFPPLPGGYAWPNVYHVNPMFAAAYNSQYIPAGCNKSQHFSVSSQNQITNSILPDPHVAQSNGNNHRISKTRNHPKQIKSH